MLMARKIQSAEEAHAALDAAERAGCGRVAWAHANNVDARSLNAWRVNLAHRRRVPLRLVELVVDAAEQAQPPVARNAGCRVRCGDFVVEVDAGFDQSTLSRVLGVVRGC